MSNNQEYKDDPAAAAVQIAEAVNLILERVHPWARVQFTIISSFGLQFHAGPNYYSLRLAAFLRSHPDLPFVHQWIVGERGGMFEYTAFARKLEAELRGWRRNDSGEMVKVGTYEQQ